jgi:hypothetical protein
MADIQNEIARGLTGFEQSLTMSNEFVPFNVIAVLRIEGALEAEALRRALASLQRRHALLRAIIATRKKGSYAFVFEKPAPIPVTQVERKSSDGWIARAEDELNRRMDIAAGPLMRCLYLRDAREPAAAGEIILTINHAILDASCALPMLAELLRYCRGGDAGAEPEVSAEGTTPATALFPRKLTGAGYARALLAYMGRQMADDASYRWRARGTRKPPIHPTGRNRILPVLLSRSLTDSLIRATRRERITMNAILSAGLLLAVKRHLYPGIDTPLRNITFADLRPYLSKPVPDSVLGCYMGLCRFTVLMRDRPDFWMLAREVHDTIYQSNRRGERFTANAMSPAMMKMIIGLKVMRMAATALSYAGPVSLGEDAGPFRVRGLHAFTSNMTIGPEYSALSRLFQGQIGLDYLYLDSDMEDAQAQRIADAVTRILEEAVSTHAQYQVFDGTRQQTTELATH